MLLKITFVVVVMEESLWRGRIKKAPDKSEALASGEEGTEMEPGIVVESIELIS